MTEQGIYQWGEAIIYLTRRYPDSNLCYRKLSCGTVIGGYSFMLDAPIFIEYHVTPLKLGWLPNSAIPSDLYPELFI